jgi:hypothetical protein
MPKFLKHLLSLPFIWAVMLPAIFLHIVLALYQNVSFPLYGLPRVRFMDYVEFDRTKLGYLRWYDKLNCAYCSYMNGFFSYAQEIGQRTEYYWCGIKHFSYPENPAFTYQEKFALYGDEQDYGEMLKKTGRIK